MRVLPAGRLPADTLCRTATGHRRDSFVDMRNMRMALGYAGDDVQLSGAHIDAEGLKFDGGGSAYCLAGDFEFSSSPSSLHVHARIDGFGTIGFGRVFAVGAGLQCLLGVNSPHLRIRYGGTRYDVPDTDWQPVFGADYLFSFVAVNNQLQVYVGRSGDVSKNVLVIPLSAGAVSGELRLGNRDTNDREFHGVMHWVKRSAHAATEREIQSLVRSRYSVLRPSRNRTALQLLSEENPASTVDLTSAAVSQASTAGTLTQSLPMQSAAASVANSNGNLALTLALDMAAVAQAASAGSLSLAKGLTDQAIANAGAAGGLSLTKALSDQAQANAGTTGTLTLRLSLAGAAVANASVAGFLDTGATHVDLSGSAQASASTSGNITQQIPLIGNAQAVARTDGQFAKSIPLNATAASVSSVIGSLDLAVSLSADALAQAGATGSFELRMLLSGGAVAQATTNGLLQGGDYQPANPERMLHVQPQARVLTVAEANRVMIA